MDFHVLGVLLGVTVTAKKDIDEVHLTFALANGEPSVIVRDIYNEDIDYLSMVGKAFRLSITASII